jgi:hypothetical protein
MQSQIAGTVGKTAPSIQTSLHRRARDVAPRKPSEGAIARTIGAS